jgi:hypothetical protein
MSASRKIRRQGPQRADFFLRQDLIELGFRFADLADRRNIDCQEVPAKTLP